jgi:hypothetical protein
LDRFAAANCQAGIEGDLLNRESGLVGLAELALGGCADPDGISGWDAVGVVPLVAEVVEDDVDSVLEAVVSDALGVTRDGEAPPPSLLPRSVFKLFNSVPSSRKRFSLPSRAPSSAFGMASFSALTSSLIRRVSSSRRRDAVFRSATKVSTSRKVASNFSVRASSAVFNAAVSVESCSIRANARENCSSICCLSCSSCGGVGGAIRGAIYR